MGELKIDQLHKMFGDVAAVRDVTVEIPDGSFAVLVGPSGCGKTTTLNMIAGLEIPTSGKVLIDGREIQDLPAHHRDIGMVFQSYALYPNRTVRGNIEFPLKVKKTPKRQRRETVERVAGPLGLGLLLDRQPRALSGGQQQRVALARAIAKGPDLFLLDEPLSNLDAHLRAEMRFELKNMQRDLGATFVLVTHDQAEALSLADLVIVMNEGSVQQIGSPEEVYTRPANMFVASFVGVPTMNMIRGVISSGEFTAGEVSLTVQGRDHEGPAVLGVRSEDVVIDVSTRGDISGTVGLSELVGADRLTEILTPVGRVIARTPGTITPEDGSNVNVSFNRAGLHYFDPEGGDRLDTDATTRARGSGMAG